MIWTGEHWGIGLYGKMERRYGKRKYVCPRLLMMWSKVEYSGYLKRIRGFNARIFRNLSTDMLDEITNNTDKYTADFDLGSLYTMYDTEFGKWKLNTGLRGEYNLFDVSTADFSGQKVNVDREYLDILPSLNLSYNEEKTKYRFSLSKTLARPEFREVANFAFVL